eukprot:1153031-Pelagomonas_calceolata.AAC.3
MVTVVMVLLLEGFRLIFGPGIFAAFDLYKMEVPLPWKELAKVEAAGLPHRRACRPEARQQAIFKERKDYASQEAAFFKERLPN